MKKHLPPDHILQSEFCCYFEKKPQTSKPAIVSKMFN